MASFLNGFKICMNSNASFVSRYIYIQSMVLALHVKNKKQTNAKKSINMMCKHFQQNCTKPIDISSPLMYILTFVYEQKFHNSNNNYWNGFKHLIFFD